MANNSPYHAGLSSPDMAAPSPLDTLSSVRRQSDGGGTTRQAPAGNPATGACRGFSFIGTAAEHLALTEKAIEAARKSHSRVRHLEEFRRKLKARAAALGA